MTRDDVICEMVAAAEAVRFNFKVVPTSVEHDSLPEASMRAALAHAEECGHGLRPRRLTEEMRKAAMAESVKLSLMLAPREYDAIWQAMYDAGGKP